MTTAEPSGAVIMHIDGGARGNPGPAAYAVVVEGGDGNPLTAFSKFLGKATNNEAEYEGLLAALEYALSHHLWRIKLVSDSELLVRQVQGRYKVKSQGLKPRHEQAQKMIARLEAFTIQHVRREENRQADRLVNEALDAAESGANRKPVPTGPPSAGSETLRVAATYRDGLLRPHRALPLKEAEEVEVEIRRKS